MSYNIKYIKNHRIFFIMSDRGKKQYPYNKSKKAARPAAAVFKGKQEEIKDHAFVFSQIKTKKWITSREKFIEYAGRKYGVNEKVSLERGEEAVVTCYAFTMPTSTEYAAYNELEKAVFPINYEAHIVKMDKLRENLSKLYFILWGQCDPAMQVLIAKHDDYRNANAKMDVLLLLEILDEACQFVERKHLNKHYYSINP